MSGIRFKEGRESVRDERCGRSKEVNTPELISVKSVIDWCNYVEVLRVFRKRPALFKSGQWHFHQDNAPVHNSILVTDYLSKMGIKTVPQPPCSPDLAPCDFWIFPKLRLSLWDNWDERGCDEGHWHAHTRGLPWGIPEVVGTIQVQIFHTTKCRAYPHEKLNTSKGVIRSRELALATEDEIASALGKRSYKYKNLHQKRLTTNPNQQLHPNI